MAIARTEKTVDNELKKLKKAVDLSDIAPAAGAVDFADVYKDQDLTAIKQKTDLRGIRVNAAGETVVTTDFKRSGVFFDSNTDAKLMSEIIDRIKAAGLIATDGKETFTAPSPDASSKDKSDYVWNMIQVNYSKNLDGLKRAFEGIEGLDVAKIDNNSRAAIEKLDRATLDKMIDAIEKSGLNKVAAPGRGATEAEMAAFVNAVISQNLDDPKALKTLNESFQKIKGLESMVVGEAGKVSLSFSTEVKLSDWLKAADAEKIEALDKVVTAAGTSINHTGTKDVELEKAVKKIEAETKLSTDNFPSRLKTEIVDKLGVKEILEKAMAEGQLNVLTKDQANTLFGEGNKGVFQLGFDKAAGKYTPEFDKGKLIVQKSEPIITFSGGPGANEESLAGHLTAKKTSPTDLYKKVEALLNDPQKAEVAAMVAKLADKDKPGKDDPSVMIQYILEHKDDKVLNRGLSEVMRSVDLKPDLKEIPGEARKQVVFSERVDLVQHVQDRIKNGEVSMDALQGVVRGLDKSREDELAAKKAIEARDAADAKAAAASVETKRVLAKGSDVAKDLTKAALEHKVAPMTDLESKAQGIEAQVDTSGMLAGSAADKAGRGLFGGIKGDKKAHADKVEAARNDAIVGTAVSELSKIANNGDRGEILGQMLKDDKISQENAAKVIVKLSQGSGTDISIRSEIDMLQGMARTRGTSAPLVVDMQKAVNDANSLVEPTTKVTTVALEAAQVTANASVAGEKLNSLLESKAVTPREAGAAVDAMGVDPKVEVEVIKGVKDTKVRAEVGVAVKQAETERTTPPPTAKSAPSKPASKSVSPAIGEEAPAKDEGVSKYIEGLIKGGVPPLKIGELVAAYEKAAEAAKAGGKSI